MATTAMNRVLGLISASASWAMLAGTVGLGRLLWDQMRSVESPPWLLEWSAKGLLGAIAADLVSRAWRGHRVAGLVTLGTFCVLYCVGRYLWLELVSALSDPLRFADQSFGVVIALFAAWMGMWMCLEWIPATAARARRDYSVGGEE